MPCRRRTAGCGRSRCWPLALIAVAFVTGYLPRQRREALLVAEANVESHADPVVNVVTVVPVLRQERTDRCRETSRP